LVLKIGLLGAALLLAACGGGSTATPASGGGGDATPTTAPASDTVPIATAGSAVPTGAVAATPAAGGGTVTNACDLISADDASRIMGSASLTTESLEGEPSYCFYNLSDATTVVATFLSHTGSKGVYDTYAAAWTKIDGIGDGAVFDADSKTLFILKGDALFSITAGDAGTEAAAMLEFAKELGVIALSHL
jgi:hypothetical protein